MAKTMQLNSEQQAWAICMVRECCGVEISTEQLMVLLTLDPHLFADILVDMDTVAREHLMNTLAEQLGFPGWVRYGNSEDDSRTFFADFPKRAVEYGYRLVEGYWKI
ncbi:hypothetical protein IQ250_01735 [Pseudanabaenaceae cyanobacterium LEGE 13415]|nr:hypothetical protein [Pseudanabaenaceae cyanobacterium LEGE 13415]